MRISVSEAKAQLTELLRRAEAGDEVVITRHGHPIVELIPARDAPVRRRPAVIKEIQAAAAAKALPGPCAARSQDFLYDENGLPA
ncbi:type II toxin-antitoxin system Phd/YefM family antitoxin [Rhizorhabdus sp.]|uniref:type II toxin-antitoxin system Phd/YefM family antitoxin n=1 Tax=Rhizorhabdus sp. TaxID=1968843 RepID=UPI0019C2B6E6|nr:type II toxin-antitoxin system prevent-host-death family antitoxin [Rhizorhabdus sp.]MBD3762234.1 type II toxin-antitoxin system prevent-host-death family antitoxin [Rhizorhabdus sp.]